MCKFIVCIFLLQNFCSQSGALQCRGEHNESVDWFMIYKIPNTVGGGGYTYITSTTSDKKWHFSNFSINDTGSILGNTLNAFYQNQSNVDYVLYNDDPPDQPRNSKRGHTKGVILADVNGGFWLIHSVPRFPKLGASYNFPSTGFKYGQSFLCISMDLANLDKVGIQLQYIRPQIYKSYIPELLKTRRNEIKKAISGMFVKQAPWYNIISIKSNQGVTFISFAKSGKFEHEMYVDLVAPFLQTDLWVETWANGTGKLPSNCSKRYNVYNVQQVNSSVANARFSRTKDHSKWAVSPNSSWICIGDINRMKSQNDRGGGTVCLWDSTISKEYINTVEAIEQC